MSKCPPPLARTAFLILLAILAHTHRAKAATLPLPFTFTLPAPATTSAGAFDAHGVLVKTLWSRVRYIAGTHSETWDGTRDDGTAAPPGVYTIKVLCHDTRYVWDGVIGNTSASFTGPDLWYTSSIPRGLAIDGATAFLATGYAEGQVGVKRFDLDHPQHRQDATALAVDTEWDYVTTDGTSFYIADVGNSFDKSNCSFVARWNVADNSLGSFASGTGVTLVSPWKTNYPSVIDLARTVNTPATADAAFLRTHAAIGIAVQKNGPILAVAHGPLNLIRLFDKTTGNSLGAISVTRPGGLAFAPNNDLWICTGSRAVRYTSVGAGNKLANRIATTITLSGSAVGVAANPNPASDAVFVADAGTQQIKAFTHTGAPLWTYGQPGGYAARGAAVTNDKFGFGAAVPLAVQADGSFWIYDAATSRLLHISAARTYREQVAWRQTNYVDSVDPNDPTRLFAGWLEYKVDYSKPLLPGDPQAPGGNRAWQLVRNWQPGAPAAALHGADPTDTFNTGLYSTVTLTNPANSRDRRTFSLALDKKQWTRRLLLELQPSGFTRDTGLRFDDNYLPGKSYTLCDNGDIRYVVVSGSIQTIYRRPLLRFRANGNPQWGAAKVLSTIPAGPRDPMTSPSFHPITSSGVVLSFDNSVGSRAGTGYHLGGSRVSGTGWLWEAAHAVSTDVPMDGLGSYDIGDGTNYGGNRLLAQGRHVVFGYHGEFWNQAEANQFMHFYDDGLFMGQFGTSTDTWRPGGRFLPGMAGNTFTPSLVLTGSQLYLWHGEESPHGGIHRWHLVGANAVQELTGSGRLGAGVTIPLTAPTTTFPTGLVATPGDSKVELGWQPVPGASAYHVHASATSGGISSIVQTVTTPAATVTGLTNSIAAYFTVTATGSDGMESAASSEVRSIPMDPTIPVHTAGQVAFFGSINHFAIDPGAPAHGACPLYLHNMFDTLGDLSLIAFGSRGYVLYGGTGAAGIVANLQPGFTATLGPGWVSHFPSSNDFKLGGIVHSRAIHTAGSASIAITVPDRAWHYLTVFSPVTFADARNDTISLTSATGAPASYSAVENLRDDIINGFVYIHGYNRIYQFLFQGNVTLTMRQGVPAGAGNLAALFFDDLPLPAQMH